MPTAYTAMRTSSSGVCTLLLRDCIHNAAAQPVAAISTGNQTRTCTEHTSAQCRQNLVQLACFLRLAEPVRQAVPKCGSCKTSSHKSCSASSDSASHLAAEVEGILQCAIRSLLCVSLLGESVCLYVCHWFSLISIGVSTSMRPFLYASLASCSVSKVFTSLASPILVAT